MAHSHFYIHTQPFFLDISVQGGKVHEVIPMWSTNPEGTTQLTATTPRNFTPYTIRIVCGFFNVPQWTYKHGRYCETWPTVYSPYPRRLKSLKICWCNYKSSTFYSVILRPWVLVRPESNSRLSAWQPAPVCGPVAPDPGKRAALRHYQKKKIMW